MTTATETRTEETEGFFLKDIKAQWHTAAFLIVIFVHVCEEVFNGKNAKEQGLNKSLAHICNTLQLLLHYTVSIGGAQHPNYPEGIVQLKIREDFIQVGSIIL